MLIDCMYINFNSIIFILVSTYRVFIMLFKIVMSLEGMRDVYRCFLGAAVR
jgi:hypothetical protein